MCGMATLGERILEAIRHSPLDDDVLAKRLGVSQRQSINQAARRLETRGLLRRIPGPDGKIVNTSSGEASRVDRSPEAEPPQRIERPSHTGTPDVLLVTCVKEKLAAPSAARDLYVSPLFKKQRAYAEGRGIHGSFSPPSTASLLQTNGSPPTSDTCRIPRWPTGKPGATGWRSD